MTNEQARPVELSAAECWELLGSAPIARVAWTTTAGPAVVPVNHVVADGTVRFRTAAYTALATKVDAELVAIEADAVDPDTRTGWSVVARGRAEVRYDGGRDELALPEPWAAGSRHTLVVVEVTEISGRRLAPA
jgi:nitroimidazol reductase NimA-like FMN-containing flavoprotein (pyridoxamine 5'-phosphate oxidase superfamily)